MAYEVQELAEVWTKTGDSVPMYMCSNVIPTRGEESGGSHFHHMVPVTKDVHMQALRKV